MGAFWAGGVVGYRLPMHRPLSLHLFAYLGYALSDLTTGGQNLTSGDPALLGTIQVRYEVWRRLSISLDSSYKRVLFNGVDLSGLKFGLGVGYEL